MKHSLKLYTVILATFLLCACGKSPEKQILGKWQEVDRSDDSFIEFFEDGTYRGVSEGVSSTESMTATWKILQDGRLKIDIRIQHITESITAELEFNDDHMILTNEDGKSTEHKRIN